MDEFGNSYSTQWEDWNRIALQIFPFTKDVDTQREVNGIIKLLDLHNKKVKVIDIGCGWGRHCLKLTEEGFEVVGVDVSNRAIESAKRFAKQTACRSVEYFNEDIMDCTFDDKFDIAINLWTSFGFYLDDTQNIEFLKAIRDCVKNGGKLFLEAVNRERALLKQSMNESGRYDYIQCDKTWWYLKEQDVIGFSEAHFSTEEGICRYELSVFSHKRGMESSPIMPLKLYTCSELKRLITESGFKVQATYGDFDGGRYSPGTSQSIIMVAEAT